jgi:hypothetical protein
MQLAIDTRLRYWFGLLHELSCQSLIADDVMPLCRTSIGDLANDQEFRAITADIVRLEQVHEASVLGCSHKIVWRNMSTVTDRPLMHVAHRQECVAAAAIRSAQGGGWRCITAAAATSSSDSGQTQEAIWVLNEVQGHSRTSSSAVGRGSGCTAGGAARVTTHNSPGSTA